MLKETMVSLYKTTKGFEGCEVVIVDNGSEDDSVPWLREFEDTAGFVREHYHTHKLPTNIGCPRALNLAISLHRKPGQPVVKIDNDVKILTDGWLGNFGIWERGSFWHDPQMKVGRPIAMVVPWHEGITRHRVIEERNGLIRMAFVPGHFCWHTGAFMDEVGYFDVLADDHYYGFEDKLMCDKAALMGWVVMVDRRVEIENLQRSYTYAPFGTEKKDEHVERIRPLYHKRLDDYKWRRRPLRLDHRGGLE